MLRINKMLLQNGKTVSLDLSAGEILEISGPNGVGKSLFLKSLARLLSSSYETFSFEEQDAKSFVPEVWRRNIMYVPPEIVFKADQTVDDFLQEPFGFEVYRHFKPSFDPKNHLGNLSGKMSLFSSGQKQQVALLRALSLAPKVLLLDEPFAQMDLEVRNRFTLILQNWCGPERAIVFVSHVPVDFTHKRIHEIR